MSEKEREVKVYAAGEMYLEVLFCVRQLKRQDCDFFLLVLCFLSEGNLTDWNPDKIVPVRPGTDTRRL